MPEPEVEPRGILVRALARQLAVEPVVALERQPPTGIDLEGRFDPGMPAVVLHRSSATLAAATRQASISSSVQCRGSPSWWSEMIPATSPPTKTGVTICAASPP